jgi:hypothetical protein
MIAAVGAAADFAARIAIIDPVRVIKIHRYRVYLRARIVIKINLRPGAIAIMLPAAA